MNTEKRLRGSSLVTRLTAGQIWRIASVMIAMDIIICIVFAVFLFKHAEHNITKIYLSLDSGNFEEIYAENYSVTFTDNIHGIELKRHLPAWLGTIIQGSRDISSLYIYPGILYVSDSLRYDAYIPSDESGGTIKISQELGLHIYDFRLFMYILLACEIIALISNIGKSRRRIRKALRPIFDLTQTAQNLNAGTFTNPPEKIHVEDAIDALNAINVNHLNTRISIADERAELRGLAGAINAMLDRLDLAYKSQLRFVSDASHELRTPISVIQGYANLLDRWGKDDPKALQESIDAIKSEADNMKDLIEQLLFLARGDNDSITLNFEYVNCTELLTEVLTETEMIDPNHNISANTSDNLYVYGDQQLLKQAIRIFVDNSIKYTPRGENISLGGTYDGEFVKISVSDNGIGISGEDLPNVFDRFFRSDPSRTRTTGGTGLGLSIAKWIIDRHGGHIEIVSRAEFGTKISFSLPAVKPVSVSSDETAPNISH